MSSYNSTDLPTSAEPTPQDPRHGVLEDICITLAVFSLIIINILLFLFWRYKALGKSPFPFRRYSTDSEAYASLHQPVFAKSNTISHPPRRVQDVLKNYASTLAHVGHSKTMGGSRSASTLYASSSDNSRTSLVLADTDDKGPTSSRHTAEETRYILANEQSPGRRTQAEVEENSIKFHIGHPEEDSTTTGDSDHQVYCEVLDVTSKRNGRHIKPLSFDFCKDKNPSPPASFVNNNQSPEFLQTEDTDDTENIYQNFRKRKPTSKFASMARSDVSSTNNSLMGERSFADTNSDWRPISFAFCRDADPQADNGAPSADESQADVTLSDGNATYEQFLEPKDPIYSQTVIRRSQRSVRQYPSTLPRNSSLSGQPLYEQPLFEQPLYENLEGQQNFDAGDDDHRYSTLHLDPPGSSSEASSSYARISTISSSIRSPTRSKGSRRTIRSRDSKPSMGSEGGVSPHAISPVMTIPEADGGAGDSPFHNIAKEIAGLHDGVDDDDPEESFPVVQMLSDRYSTGNFLNKFY
ncbi:uncharacterized protein [Diadema antillarum]|uniref:uncharacterized protein n=1 Tax=Diadema antillarum TaxID=105358 RepID=UPI003A896D0E